MSGDTILLWLVLLPLAGGLVSCAVGAFFDKRDPKASEWLEKIGLAVTLAAVLVISLSVAINTSQGRAYELVIPKICAMGLTLVTDSFRGMYLVVTSFAWLTTTVIESTFFARVGRSLLLSMIKSSSSRCSSK